LTTWQQPSRATLTLLGGEPTRHPEFVTTLHLARALGYEFVSTTTDAQPQAARKLARLLPADLGHVRVSLDGGSHLTHDQVRGAGTFAAAVTTASDLAARGFDVSLVCGVSATTMDDCLKLLDVADDVGAFQVEYRVSWTPGRLPIRERLWTCPLEWIRFYESLPQAAAGHAAEVVFRPTWVRADRAALRAEALGHCLHHCAGRVSVFPDGRSHRCSLPGDSSPGHRPQGAADRHTAASAVRTVCEHCRSSWHSTPGQATSQNGAGHSVVAVCPWWAASVGTEPRPRTDTTSRQAEGPTCGVAVPRPCRPALRPASQRPPVTPPPRTRRPSP
nr:radical SAM protein [Micromonospora sp. DSM 115978]